MQMRAEHRSRHDQEVNAPQDNSVEREGGTRCGTAF
jgi:hypothetical protein